MHTHSRTSSNAIAALFLIASPWLRAADFTWDGGAVSSLNWTVGANWAGDIAPPFDGTADVIFSSNAGLNPNANLDWNVRSLQFASGALGFTVEGNTLTLGAGGITNADDSVQIVQNNIVLAVAQTFGTTSTGSMAILGNINTNGRVLTVSAATDFITLGGAITGSGGLVVTGNAGLVLTGDGSNTYTGGTTINGAVTFAKTGGATAVPGALVIGNDTGTASVAIGFDEQIANSEAITINEGAALSLGSGVTETIAALNVPGGVAQIGGGTLGVGAVSLVGGSIASGSGGKLMLNGNITAVSSGSQRSSISGTLNLAGATRTITVGDGAASTDLEIQAAISNGNLVKEGAGNLAIRGAQNYGSLLARAGAVDMETPLGVGAASVSVIPSGGTATVNFEANQRLATLTIGNGGIVTLTSPTGSSDFMYEAGGGFAQAVPEPGAGLLLLAALGILAGRRRNGRGERI